MTAGEYKRFKGLKKQNLRDNMTDMELILSMLAEESTEKYLNNFRTLPKKYQKIISDTIFLEGYFSAYRLRKDYATIVKYGNLEKLYTHI